MNDKRVNEWELSSLNPGKQFLTDFELSECGHVHSTLIDGTDENIKEIGPDAIRLANTVAKIHGIDQARVSRKELRVFKLPTHTWEELTPLIRNAFKEVYGENIEFSYENQLVLWIRRLRVELKS